MACRLSDRSDQTPPKGRLRRKSPYAFLRLGHWDHRRAL